MISPFQNSVARYTLSIGAVGTAFGLKLWVIPVSGTEAFFVLFFVAVMAVVVYLTMLMNKGREAAQDANRQLRSAKEDLARAEARTRELIELAPDAFFEADLNAHVTDVNQAACRLLGYPRDELIGKTIFDLIPADAPRLAATQAQLLAPGRVSRAEWVQKRKDGTLVAVEVSSNILPDGRWQAFVRDITERTRAVEALRVAEAKFSSIVSIAVDAIISLDEHQRITIFNECAEHMFGYSQAEVLGRPLDILIPQRFRAIHHRRFASFAASSGASRHMAQRREVFGLRKNGEEFPGEASISKVIVGGGSLFSVVLRDITERQRIEQALRRAVTARDHVLRIVAHDLRSPLTSILHSVTLARRTADPERPNKPLEIISRAATRMDHLIAGLLDLSVIESGGLKIERDRLSTSDLVLEAVEMQRPLAASSGVDIRVELAQRLDGLWGNRDRLYQVFENLIGNAIKFTEAGGHVTVGAASNGHEILFWVADTGRGMPPESLAHVFDRFWQAIPRAGRLGAGLGLTITKGIVDAHGGHIWVESTVGKGSTFFFTIPKANVDANAA